MTTLTRGGAPPGRDDCRAGPAHGPQNGRMADRRVTVDDLGASLIKGNADAVDLTASFAARPRVTGWCVRPGEPCPGVRRAGARPHAGPLG
ncbi:hypothetical protein GA0070215_103275 [Micromonospora marina]|uniref:Uncharacterized protein n=2 Tax=Micromonospora marina TaxID=307120 RepID=A0A1C4VMP7_9ACTN|nr:hypothetical protein GA0070215_103275 [Micromonospora marina]